MTLTLTNKAGVNLAISNEFETNIKWELDDCKSTEDRLDCVNRNAKYSASRMLEYKSETKEVYSHTDHLGNVDYLIARF